jgi:hypothetical protein
MMQNAGLTPLLLALCSIICGCKPPDHTVMIEMTDVTKPQTLRLISYHTNVNEVCCLTLQITGRIDGAAYLFPINQKTQRVAGVVNLNTYQDWFNTNYIFDYVPEGVSTGKLVVFYLF